jgi:hypothetical protein
MSDYMRIWKLRKAALEKMLGPADNRVMKSRMPICLGGFADVMCFSDFLAGKSYVNGGLVGLGSQQPNASGPFELMICTREESGWAANLISRLARYTHDVVLPKGSAGVSVHRPAAKEHGVIKLRAGFCSATRRRRRRCA